MAGAVVAFGHAAAPSAAIGGRRQPQIVGSGRIGEPIPGKTIPSPSDFGFAADLAGGTFVCSMFGPETGGWKGCSLMTIEGIVTPSSLQLFRGTATFSGKVAIFVFPDVFTGGPYLSLGDVDYQVTATLGGPGEASMILHIPAVTETVGGDTGGIVAIGRIARKRVRP
jgi:hypothetical protein